MNKKQIQERTATINALLSEVNNNPINTLTVNDVNLIVDKLHRYEQTLNRLFTAYCDRELTVKEWNKVRNTEEKVKTLLALFNLKVYFNQDPRGGAIRFYLSSGRSNNLGGEDWGIYW